MEINNQTVGSIAYNEVSNAGCIKLVNCTVTGEIRGNRGAGRIELINCEFPNGLKVIENECEIVIIGNKN